MQIKVKNKRIGDGVPVFIIAEIGTNHNGRLDLALRMVREAAKAGVDAVKLQVVDPDESYVKPSPSYKIFKKIRLDISALRNIKRKAEKRGLIFFATPGDMRSLEILVRLKVPLIKISSGCMTNITLLRKIAKTRLPVIMSTGMSYLDEVKKAVSELEAHGAKKIALLHCVSSYPTSPEEANLKGMGMLRSEFRYPIGYSDHTAGNLASFASVALGGKIIEKHFTLDKKLKGPDHHFSADPKDLRQLVDGIRNIEKMIQDNTKTPAKSEKKSRSELRRFLVAARDLKKGTVLKEDYVAIKRLTRGAALSPEYYDKIIGRKIIRDIGKDKPITMGLLK